MIIPELPDYLRSLGGEKYLGLHITLFTITAGISRPFSGKLADTIGRIPVMIVGAVVCFFVGFVYPLTHSVFAFLLLRLIHGFSTGFKPTGTSAYVGDLVPVNRRGEAMGILGISGMLGMAFGPYVGSVIAMNSSMDIMFYSSSVTAIFSILILLGMKETLPNTEKFKVRHLGLNKSDFFEKRVLPPSIVMACTAFTYGIMLTIIPDFTIHLGIENKGLFFSIFTVASIGMRLLAGKASDRFGRLPVIRVSALVLTLSMIFFGFIDSFEAFVAGSLLLGVASGMLSPSVFAWTIDLSDDKRRGRGMATMFIALEIGIGAGSFLAGWLFVNFFNNFSITFWSGAFLGFIALLYSIMINSKKYDVIRSRT
jgi:MFS family permease